MKALPFTVSSKARAMIEESLRMAEGGDDELARMVPSLYCLLNSRTRDSRGKIVEQVSVVTFGIGWYYPKQVKDFVAFDFFGRKLVIHPTTLKMIRRKRLVVRMVNCGYPDRASKRKQVLRAVRSTH